MPQKKDCTNFASGRLFRSSLTTRDNCLQLRADRVTRDANCFRRLAFIGSLRECEKMDLLISQQFQTSCAMVQDGVE